MGTKGEERRGQSGKNPPPQNPSNSHTLTDKARKGNNGGLTVMVLSSKIGELISLVATPTNIAVFLLKSVCQMHAIGSVWKEL